MNPRHHCHPLDILRALSCVLVMLFVASAQAQFRVDVSGVGMKQLPIAVAPFRGEDAAVQKPSFIARADLERSGQFVALATDGAVLDELARPNLSAWRQQGADSLVTGSVTRLVDGRYDLRFRLWDVVQNQDLGGEQYAVAPDNLRWASHRMADYIFEKLTGDRGAFATQIAYVTRSAKGYNLWVAEADGENAKSAFSSAEPIISPAWSPDGTQLAYVSFETRKPVVYVHEIGSGKKRLVANFRGNNSAPAWSADGRSLALTLSKDGGSQLNVIDAAGGEPRRLGRTGNIDTEPVYSADGRHLYFVSDASGSPQIYKMPANGGNAERVTFAGKYNISPSVSADGRWLAYVSSDLDGSFRLHVLDLTVANASPVALTQTTADESPSFSPNSRMIIYATQAKGQEALMTTTVDGKIQSPLAGKSGDIREPAWGPFLKQ